jgi:hypothetical protein
MPANLETLQLMFAGRFKELGKKASLTEFGSVENIDCWKEFLWG